MAEQAKKPDLAASARQIRASVLHGAGDLRIVIGTPQGTAKQD